MDEEQIRQRRRRSRARSRRRRQEEKRRRVLLLVLAVLAAILLAAAGAVAGGRKSVREEAGSIRPELLPGDDTGIGLGGKPEEAEAAENSRENGESDQKGSQEEAQKETLKEEQKETQKEAMEKGDSEAEKMAAELLSSMTLEEKIFQLFMVTPEALTGYDEVYMAGEATKDAIWERPVGGIVYFSQNLKDKDQTREMLAKTARYGEERSGLPPFLAVDEEGGQVARISGKEGFSLEAFPDMSKI